MFRNSVVICRPQQQGGTNTQNTRTLLSWKRIVLQYTVRCFVLVCTGTGTAWQRSSIQEATPTHKLQNDPYINRSKCNVKIWVCSITVIVSLYFYYVLKFYI